MSQTTTPVMVQVDVDTDTALIETTFANNQKKYVYISSAPPIENVVFSGGGAKGAVYPGVIKALEGQKIKHVAGSSIGAITAALYAAGITGDTFKKITKEQNFAELLGSGHLQKTGEPILAFLRKHIAISILTTLQRGDRQEMTAVYQHLSDNDKSIIHHLLGDPDKTKGLDALLDELPNTLKLLAENQIEISDISFKALNTLRQFNQVTGIDGAFKSLSVTSVNRETGELYILNNENTENLEIALACRASASLPVLLAPVAIKKEVLGIYAERGDGVFVDGGLLDNIPVSTVDSRQEKELGMNLGEQGQNLQTLAFIFDETTKTPYAELPQPSASQEARAQVSRETTPPAPETYQSPYLGYTAFDDHDFYAPNLFERIYRNLLPRVLAKVKTPVKNTEAKARGLKQIATDFGQRNVPLFVGGISSQSFGKAQEMADELMAKSEAQTREYLEIHKEEAISLSSDNPVSLLLMIPMQKLDVLLTDRKTVFDLTPDQIAKLKAFRIEVNEILKANKNQDLLSVFSHYAARNLKSIGNTAPYCDYIVDQLHADKTRWNEILKQLPRTYSLNSDLYKAIFKRDAQDKLIDKQRELVSWLKQEIEKQGKNGKSPNLAMLEAAKDKVRATTTFQALADAIVPVAENYHEAVTKLTMMNLLRKPATVTKAENFAKELAAMSLRFDAYLPGLEEETKSQELPEMASPSGPPVAEQARHNETVAFIDLEGLDASEETAKIMTENLTAKDTFEENRIWKAKFEELLKKMEAYALTLANDAQKAEFLALKDIANIDGSYKDKCELMAMAYTRYIENNQVRDIMDPLIEIKKNLDEFIKKNHTGFRRFYYGVLNKLDISTLGTKKMDFALRYREHVDTVLASAGPEKKNSEQLKKASHVFLGLFDKDYNRIYKGNEQDRNNPQCKFRQCMAKIKEPLEKLQAVQRRTI